METIEIDLEGFSKNELITLIDLSIENDLKINDLIVKIIEDYLSSLDSKK